MTVAAVPTDAPAAVRAPASRRPAAVARAWWSGRFGHRAITEVVAITSLLTLYRLGRYVARNNVDAAFDHAVALLHVERVLGIASEQGLQHLLLDHVGLVRFLNRYYGTVHFPLMGVFLVVAYIKTPDVYRRLRGVVIGVTGVGLVMQMMWPLAPPRMLPGFVDTVAVYGPTIYDKPGVSGIANQYAAMPSLHVGWALIIGIFALHVFRGPWRWLGMVHCGITVLAVVGTANHYWLDGVVGAGLVLVAVVVDVRVHQPNRWLTPGFTPAPTRLSARTTRPEPVGRTVLAQLRHRYVGLHADAVSELGVELERSGDVRRALS